MIRLPEFPSASNATPALLDYGVTLRPATGGPVQKVQRAGSRYRMEFNLPPMQADTARVFISRLIEAKRKGGLIMPMPLTRNRQGAPGSPVVNGAGQAGTTLLVRNTVPGHLWKEGYWIAIVDQTGQRYLHNVRENVATNGAGQAALRIEPPLRFPFLDGAQILASKPEIQGFIDGGEWSWSLEAAGITGITFTIEEAR